jgi:hypothetical protein
MDKPADHAPSRSKDSWDKVSLAVDIAHKIIILIIGSAAAGVFYWFQQQQLDSRYFSDLMSQRESSDSQLRTQMFKTLFDAYFSNKLQAKAPPGDQASPKPGESGAGRTPTRAAMFAQLARLKQETMFTDLLSRNFESIDVRPLFEDLDAQLATLLESAGESKALLESRREIFTLREQLRRVAVGTSSRQATALVSRAGAKLTTYRVTQCRGEAPVVEPAFRFTDFLIVDKLNDGAVAMRIVPAKPPDSTQETESIRLRVSFYDMPSLENIVLPNGERVAFTLSRYLSSDVCRKFKEELDESVRSDCQNPRYEKRVCDRAWIRAIVLPKQFIGVRDRPYFNDLVTGKFRQ